MKIRRRPPTLALSTAFAASLVLLAAAPAARAQIGPGPFAAFPTADPTDARMLSFGCAEVATFEQELNIRIDVPPSSSQFTVSIFDGDTGKTGPDGKLNWDLGTRQLLYAIYLDPLLANNQDPADLVGQWTGNDPNSLSGPNWTVTSATMPNNDWWGVTLQVPPEARTPSGNAYYNLVVREATPCVVGEARVSNIKIAADSPMTFGVPRFGFESSLRQPAGDGPIVYPGSYTVPSSSYVAAPTTNDGTFEFFLQVGLNAPDLTLFDGDFDHGTSSLVSFPSATVLQPCADTDDPDTAASFAGFGFTPVGALPEGVNTPGAPADDSFLDLFRRGEPGDPGRVGCVRYEVIAPDGRVFRNDNPSGNLEWEQFRIAGQMADDPGLSDYLLPEDYVPAGTWKVRIVGLDLSNLNFWLADACATVGGEPACPSDAVYLVGDTVFHDLDRDGIQDPGEPGIAGVAVELYTDLSAPPVAVRLTGDSSAPDWENCLLHNTGNDAAGLYCFGVPEGGTYHVVVAAENFAPGGALAGLASTTGGESQSDVVADANVLTYDFGYAAQPTADGTGTVGYWKNHPEAWPVTSLTVGGVTYSREQAIALMNGSVGGDMTIQLVRQWLAAQLNVLAGNASACIAGTLADTDAYLAVYPVGSKPKGSAKAAGESLKNTLDEYNNGRLCAPKRR